MRLSRRHLLEASALLAMSSLVRNARAETVPFARQAELLAKVAAYDKNFANRAGDRARVLVVVKKGQDDSVRAASQMAGALKNLDAIGGLPIDVNEHAFSSAGAVAEACKSSHASIVYLTSGLADDVSAIADSLRGADILSVAAEPGYVERRAVLGFDLVSGKPRLLVHLTQARAQNVDFRAEVLKLMKVFE